MDTDRGDQQAISSRKIMVRLLHELDRTEQSKRALGHLERNGKKYKEAWSSSHSFAHERKI
eukprot:4343152-Amphidinium_carterae.1